VEVILPRLSSEHVLTFLGDVTKKLKNNVKPPLSTDLELWVHFEKQLLAYLV
jgi:hypothetical protein